MRIIVVAPNELRRPLLDRLLDRRTPREMGRIVRDLQRASATNLHANAKQCMACAMQAQALHAQAYMALPRRYRRNEEWRHQHVVMPAARIYARMLDEEAAR